MTIENFDRFGDEIAGWDTEAGLPGICLFGNALQVWALCQPGDVSITAAARAFNCPPQRVIEAVEDHSWMYLTGPQDDYERLLIEHDGE